MKRYIKGMLAAATVMLSAAMVFPAMAATSIEDITLNITSYIKEGDISSNVSVVPGSHKYEVTDVDVTNEPDDGWEEGDNPKLKITLGTDDDDYKFTSSLTKSDVTIKGNDATVTKINRASSSKLYVYVTLNDVIEDDEAYTAQPDIREGKQHAANNNPKDTLKKNTWEKDSRGWRRSGDDGSLIKNKWQQIDDKWYYFDAEGYMATGWQKVDGKWYYLNENGEMLHDTVTPDGYKVGPDGALEEEDE